MIVPIALWTSAHLRFGPAVMVSLVIAASQGFACCRFFACLCGKRGFLDNHALLRHYRCAITFAMTLVGWIHRLGDQSQGGLLADAAY
ncbi:hypothetical protein [Xanthomonas citri]|uniref:hypothetical protein n=1 Tax=Xanthomonas citri TaxID=346 RepID=UPI0005284A32|nr:hypothetical protein [Xanthomonas citri]MBE0316660.1 hypothetical protein [Xanthomonas citri pv. punicae]MDS0759274.1 hypothetical protein [Xanthomonas citri pv. punicae]MDS0763052.1 hypothetical protein [Xanthomonas citri pv. punicae]MDS0797820.1 hypothetical protein [Xanthomonas citri pv. punicae]MDS0838280.1 hypothetical protein [Xanthomonas citri pv. punicae]